MNRKILMLAGVALLMLCGIRGMAAEDPFVWSTSSSADELRIILSIAQGGYVYADTVSLRVSGRNGEVLSLLEAPSPTLKTDGAFGEIKVFTPGKWVWRYKGNAPFRADVGFSGCIDGASGQPGVCLPPAELQLLPDRSAAEAIAAEVAGLELDKLPFKLRAKLVGTADVQKFLAFLKDGQSGTPVEKRDSVWWMLLLAVLGGILLNFTPCVLPMIPVNLIIIQASGKGAWTGFRRGGAYALGMTAAYGTLGALAALGGARFGDLNSSSVFNFAIAGVFLVLAAATAGLFDLDLARFKSRAGGRSRLAPSLGAFVMGVLAALLAGACVAPVVLTVLIFTAERYQAGYPAALLMPLALGVGMGLPWPFAGMGLAVLPKPGRFMVYVKYVFAAVIFALAVYYFKTGWDLRRGDYSVDREFSKLESALIRAGEEHKPVLIDFYATWCKNCKYMDDKVLSDPQVKAALDAFVVVKFQAEDLSDPRIRGLLKHWDIPGLPAFVILEERR